MAVRFKNINNVASYAVAASTSWDQVEAALETNYKIAALADEFETVRVTGVTPNYVGQRASADYQAVKCSTATGFTQCWRLVTPLNVIEDYKPWTQDNQSDRVRFEVDGFDAEFILLENGDKTISPIALDEGNLTDPSLNGHLNWQWRLDDRIPPFISKMRHYYEITPALMVRVGSAAPGKSRTSIHSKVVGATAQELGDNPTLAGQTGWQV